MIDFNLMEILIAFDKNKTLLKTAETLHISQPALTVAMKKLEKALDVKLFNREKNKISLNDSGIYLVSLANKLIQERDTMLYKIKSFDKSHTVLNIGMQAIAPNLYYLPMIEKKHDIKIISTIEDKKILINKLRNGLYDFIFITEKINYNNYICKKIFTEQLYFFLNKNHPLAKKDTLSFKEVDGESILMNREIGFWGQLVRDHMPNSHFILQDNLDNLRLLVDNSTITSFASNLTLNERTIPNRVPVKISDHDALVNFYIVYNKSKGNIFNKYFNIEV